MNAPVPHRAVFLDRDGVLVEEVHLLTRADQIKIPADVPAALQALKTAGFQLIVVSNQTVIARGLSSEEEVANLNVEIERRLVKAGAPKLDAWHICPHHPQATLAQYRKECDCRKPKPGLLRQAAREQTVDLAQSFMVGDRLTDIIAGKSAGCRTALLTTGAHALPPIETSEPVDWSIRPDFTAATLQQAADWILNAK